MADVYLLQHSFQGQSGLPRDEFVNTFHFEKDADAVGSMLELSDQVHAMWTATIAPAVVPMITYMSHTINAFPATVKIYRLSDPKPRPEVFFKSYDLSLDVDAGSNQTVPYEVAICLSYNAAPIPGVSPGRLRGRIYLGPWNNAALGLDSRPLSTLLDQMRTGAKAVCNFENTRGWHWGVYSPTRTAGAGGVHTIAPIVAFSTDDAYDTQRRRGNDPTARESLAV